MNITADSNKRRALGKGLESLLPSRPKIAPDEAGGNTVSSESRNPLELRIAQIERSPFQTRTHFDEASLQELADSIAATGVVQPILVRALPDQRFQLIAGERRWLASKQAGKTTIPAIVRNVSDEQAMEMTIVENLQREDLNPMEQARAFERLSRDFKMTQEAMAHRTGKNRASVANFLRLLRLPAEVQAKVEEGQLSFGHAKALLALPTEKEIHTAVQKITALSMSVRQAENYIQGILHPENKQNRKEKDEEIQDPNVREVQEQLQRALGLKVRIDDKNGRGKVIIEYARLEDFDTLLGLIATR